MLILIFISGSSFALENSEQEEGLTYTFSNGVLEDVLKEANALVEEDNSKEEEVPCSKNQEEASEVLPESFDELHTQVEEAYAEVYKTKVLMNADITYSFAKAQVADAQIRLTTLGDRVEYIEMEGVYNILGMAGNVKYGFSIDQILRGETLDFYADFDSNPILRITPGSNFRAETGGEIHFQFWDGKRYQGLKGHLAKDTNNEFHLFINKVAPQNYVNYLNVNVRGLRPSAMRIKDYGVAAH